MNDKANEAKTMLPEWLARRVEILQALKEKGLTLEEIRFIAGAEAVALNE